MSESKNLSLSGKVAIVTGASRGIGRGIAVHLASLGAKIVLNYVANSAQADQLAAEINSLIFPTDDHDLREVAFRADVAVAGDVKALFDHAQQAFGPDIHILVNCAGVLDSKYLAIADTAEEDWDTAFAVNAKGAFLCCREAAKRLVRGGGGSGRIIAFSSSLVGTLTPGYAAHTAAKTAVEVMIKTMAKELKGTRITANCVAPGPVATDHFFAGKSEAAVQTAINISPMGRLGRVEDIAPVVGFLAGDASEWINGQVIRVNSGYV